jgi:hypothetical protein
MSKILKKVLKRASWIPGDTQQYLPSTPEVPPDFVASAGNSHNRGGDSHFEVERPEEEEDAGNPITIAIVGAGQRGKVRAHDQTLRALLPHALGQPLLARPETDPPPRLTGICRICSFTPKAM